jgi:hypothetical protein
MRIRYLPITICVLLLKAFSTVALGAETDSQDYIKVEIKGTLSTGVMAIGAETTGTVIQSGEVRWELDFGSDEELRRSAAKLNKKKAIVTGIYERRRGVEIRERHVVKVSALKPAD